MADVRKRLSNNVDGEFFVDSTCINCDACRQIAPETFEDSGDYSFVYSQPQTPEEKQRAIRALLSCPTGSIGTLHKNNAKEVMDDFPLHIEDGVYYCGFNSPKSYGGNSYFVHHTEGNWLIDSPKYIRHLVKRLDELGGIKYIFLTHRDDVADARRYAKEFESARIIHRAELSAQPDAEMVIDGKEPVQISPDFLIVPTSGHTRGHRALLYKNRFLFTGDHMWWDRDDKRLSASEDVCWYSWPEQIESTEKLRNFTFEWVLPGHGQRINLPSDAMRKELIMLVSRIQSAA